jgi:peroxiredoxin
MKVKVYLLLALIVMNVVLLWRVVSLQRITSSQRGGNQEYPIVSPYFVLLDLQGHRWSIDSILQNRSHALLVFFTLQDCPSCLGEQVLWKKLFENIGVNVIAIARHIDEGELRIWIENAKITFPVLYDKEGEVANLFGIHRTPMKVLLDARGRIRLFDPFRTKTNQMEEFVLLLKRILMKDFL